MKTLRLTTGATVAALLAMLMVQACSGIPQDNRYENRGRGGGWENFRAEAPADGAWA